MRLRSRALPNAIAVVRICAAIVAAVLGAAVFATSAWAGPVEEAMLQDYIADGDITSCRFTKPQLQTVRGYIPTDDAYYADLLIELDREIARWTSGACSPGGGPGGTGGGTGGTGGHQTGTGGGQTGTGGGQQAAAYRAAIDSLMLARNRGSVKVRLRCPATAPSACKVKLSGKLGAGKAVTSKSSTIAPGSSRTVKLKLTRSAAQKLSKQGGKLKISARTVGSSLAAASRSVTVTAST